jgi:predicted component of type VI protein secretion system
MKKVLFMIAISGAVLAGCSSTNEAEKEKQDSIAAAATADSLLNATLAADSAAADTVNIDSINAK